MRHFIQKEVWIILMLLALFLFPGCHRSAPTAPETEAVPTTTEPMRVRKEGIQTLLISCLEPMEVPQNSGVYRNGNKAGFCLLLIIDEKQGKTSAIQLDPGTMVSFLAQGMQKAVDIPLSMTFSYGSGGSDSCLNYSKAVSGLLDDVFIDHYMTFTVDALPIVNDLIGGVTVPTADDLPNELSELVQEESLTLSGEQTVAYFTYRGEEDLSNEARMERQSLYIRGMYTPFLENAQDDNFLTKLTMQLGDRLSTDLTLSQMVQMMEILQASELDETAAKLDGVTEEVDGEFQFHVDSNSLKQVLDAYFYQ